MQDTALTFYEWFSNHINQEWFVAVIALIATLVIFFLEQRSGNRISRSDFIYRINNDFSSSERILKVYEWIGKCCDENRNIPNYRRLTNINTPDIFSQESEVSFSDIDTYINLFESVFVIRKAVKMRNLDRLFQQRFLTFMHNPYVQREVLFPNFHSNGNLFMLYKIWLRMPYRRFRLDSFRFARYLSSYTCGDYEYKLEYENYKKLSPIRKLHRRWVQIHYINSFVRNICDPDCKYGYYLLQKRDKATGLKTDLTVRIIRSDATDVDDIFALQSKVMSAMPRPEFNHPSEKAEFVRAVEDHYFVPLQIDVNDKIAAFALLILRPEENYRLSRYADSDCAAPSGIEGVLETVFVDPEFRGYGMQRLLVDVICRIARYRKAKSVWATVHPDNLFSYRNIEQSGFTLAAKEPIDIYGSKRRLYVRDVSHLKMKDKETGRYCIYPEL